MVVPVKYRMEALNTLSKKKAFLDKFFQREGIRFVPRDSINVQELENEQLRRFNNPPPWWSPPRVDGPDTNPSGLNPFYPTLSKKGHYRAAKYSLRRVKIIWQAANALKEAGDPLYIASLPPVPPSVLPKPLEHIGVQKMWGGKTLYDKPYRGTKHERESDKRRQTIAEKLAQQPEIIKNFREARREKRQGKTYPF